MSEKEIKSATNLQKIRDGFKINWMKMKDGSNGQVLWESKGWDLLVDRKEEFLPKEILKCSSVNRELNFSSAEEIKDLSLVQNFYLKEELIESNRFRFGFVIPNSTNNWSQQIEAKQEILPHSVLSGHLNVETLFLTNEHIISRNEILIYYV